MLCVPVCARLCASLCVCVHTRCMFDLQITDAVLDTDTVDLLLQARFPYGVLEFRDCSWPLPVHDYARLGHGVPLGVWKFELRGSGHSVEVAQSICQGAARCRQDADHTLRVVTDRATAKEKFGWYVELEPCGRR